MTRPMLNVVAPIVGMAILGGLLGLCWKDPRWTLLALPFVVGFFQFSTSYGSKGMDAADAAKSALCVACLVAVACALIFLFNIAPTL